MTPYPRPAAWTAEAIHLEIARGQWQRAELDALADGRLVFCIDARSPRRWA